VESLASALLVGAVVGFRHASDADHVVAVGAIASRERSLAAALGVGASWGLGHALTLLVVGGAILASGVVVPPRLGLLLELGVAVMLILLGLANLWSGGSVSRAGDREPRSNEALGRHSRGPLLRSLGVGVVHGLAGSAAVALLVVASVSRTELALVYLLVFGIGTVLGMLALTLVMAAPVALASGRFEALGRRLTRFAGAVSVAFGAFLFYEIGFVEGLFL
jgi:high-affinity nickel-transport protein